MPRSPNSCSQASSLDGAAHQNLTFPAHSDPVRGRHCWHQKVTVAQAEPTDRYGDIFVDTNRAAEVYRQWLALARPAAFAPPDPTVVAMGGGARVAKLNLVVRDHA